jgi:hypothetical protein
VEVQRRQAAREEKGLPPRVTLLPDWDKGDEERYDAKHLGKQRSEKRGGKQDRQGGKSKYEGKKRSATTSERRGRK